MRNFEEDWELVNQVNDDLFVSKQIIEDFGQQFTQYIIEIEIGDDYIQHEPSDLDIDFIEKAKEMVLYYMNRVRELEEAGNQKPPMAQVEQWMNDDYKMFIEEFKMKWTDAFKKVIKKYEEEYRDYGIITMGSLNNKDVIYFRPYGLPKKKKK